MANMKIGDICKVNQQSYAKNDEWEFVNYLDTGNITNNFVDSIQRIDLLAEKLPSRAKRKVIRDSIIYSTVRPNQRHYGIVKAQPENFLVSTGFVVIDAIDGVADADYLYYYLTQNEVVDRLQAIAEQSVSTYPSIKASDIEGLDIDLPDIETQQKTAKVLRSLEEKIHSNKEINNNLAA